MILGLDVSTSIVGLCALTDDGDFIKTDFVDLRKIKHFNDKCGAVSSVLEEYLRMNMTFVDYIYIEDKLSGFSGGRTMQQTLMKLASFNGVVTYLCRQYFGINATHIHPSTAKAVMRRDGLIIPKGANKKKITLDFVRRVVPEFPYVANRNDNPQPYCYDMADAYLIAKTGYLKFQCGESKK